MATYRPKGKIVLRRIGADRLLVPVSGDLARESCVFPLNETGEFIWSRLARGVSVEVTAGALSSEFDVELAEARNDCVEFAEELVRRGMLEVMT